MKKIVFIVLTVTFVLNVDLPAQEKWKLSGQIRQRFEMDDKNFDSETNSNNFNLLRSRLGITFAPEEDVTAFFQVQDSRTFGEETSTLGDGSADNIDLHQGYINIKNLFDLPVDLKAGRMEVNFGPQRLVGAVGWHNIGRSFDGVIFNLRGKDYSVDFFNFDEVEQLEVGNTGDQNVLGAYGDFKLANSHKTQAFLIWQKRNPTESLSRYTLGFYANGKFGDLRHETEFAYQGGKLTSGGTELDVRALMAALNLGYTSGNMTITLGADYLSGDDDPGDDKFKVFDTMYATNHKYYGHMDYFLNIPGHTFGLGLLDMHAKLSATPWPKTGIKAAFHVFNANQDYSLSDGSTAKDFGSEVDVTIDHKYRANVSFVGGVSFFFPGEIFKDTRGNDTSSWFYIMSIVNL